MLEACVDKRTGEIIVVKPKGQPWSAAESNGPFLVVVELDDPDLDLQGDVRAYPYAVYSDDPELGMVEISRWKVNTRELTPGKRFRLSDLKEYLVDYPDVEDLR